MKYLLISFLSFLAFQAIGQHEHSYEDIFNKHNGHSKYESKEYKLAHSGGNLIISGVADVSIESYSGSEIILSANVEVKSKGTNNRAKGLKVLDSRGIEDNTGLGYSLTKSDGNLLLSTLGHAHCDCSPLTIKLPKGIGLVIEDKTFRGEVVWVKNFQDPIEMSLNSHNVHLENVTGPMAVKTLHGNVEAIFDKISQDGTISIVAVHSFVDVSLPATTKANLTLKTSHGEIYSDMDIDLDSKNSKSASMSKVISGTINGGGVNMTLNSNFNEVYLRKI